MRTIYAIVGMKHKGSDAAALVAALKPGDDILLILEPTNQYDPRAIQVWVHGQHVGYVASRMNKVLTEYIQNLHHQVIIPPAGRPVMLTTDAAPSGADAEAISSFGMHGKFNHFERQPGVEIEE